MNKDATSAAVCRSCCRPGDQGGLQTFRRPELRSCGRSGEPAASPAGSRPRSSRGATDHLQSSERQQFGPWPKLPFCINLINHCETSRKRLHDVLFIGWLSTTGDPGKRQKVQELPGDSD